jgi:hypothetical protein
MNIPHLIEETSLSEAWCKVLEQVLAKGEITPLVLTLTQFDENLEVRNILNADLLASKFNPIDMVAETIFPDSLYHFLDEDRQALYTTYLNVSLPRIRKIDKRNNGGTYFERLIAFGGQKNQLEIIISSIIKNNVKRRSKLQATTFDPLTDHKEGAFQGFPCLQQVTFYKSETGGLILNTFYAVQYLHQKAYGNWLGLINLGKFVAAETNLRFERFNCFVGVEQLGPDISITHAKDLLKKINVVR